MDDNPYELSLTPEEFHVLYELVEQEHQQPEGADHEHRYLIARVWAKVKQADTLHRCLDEEGEK